MSKPKRELILEAIKKGGQNVESLMAVADCSYASVMSNLSTLRLMGHYPVCDVETEGEEGLTYRIVDKEEWEEILEARAANAGSKTPAKTPAERKEALEKRLERLEKAAQKALERANKDEDNELLQLRAEKVTIELRIASLELENLCADNPELLEEENEPAEVGLEEAMEDEGPEEALADPDGPEDVFEA